MSAHLSLAPLLESFFRRRLTKQRNASPSTVASYRDALRMLVLFVAERTGRKAVPHWASRISIVTLFLLSWTNLKRSARTTVQTRNARLTAIRSFFHHVAANDPASLGSPSAFLLSRLRERTSKSRIICPRNEVDALIDAPDQQTPRGRRDRALLLFPGAHRRARFGSHWRQR